MYKNVICNRQLGACGSDSTLLNKYYFAYRARPLYLIILINGLYAPFVRYKKSTRNLYKPKSYVVTCLPA